MPPLREAGGIGLSLDELLAAELRDGVPFAVRVVEAVVLLRGEASERVEDVRVVSGALAECPILEGGSDHVGGRRVEAADCRRSSS